MPQGRNFPQLWPYARRWRRGILILVVCPSGQRVARKEYTVETTSRALDLRIKMWNSRITERALAKAARTTQPRVSYAVTGTVPVSDGFMDRLHQACTTLAEAKVPQVAPPAPAPAPAPVKPRSAHYHPSHDHSHSGRHDHSHSRPDDDE